MDKRINVVAFVLMVLAACLVRFKVHAQDGGTLECVKVTKTLTICTRR